MPHEGETPPQVINEILESSKLAVDAIDLASDTVKTNLQEFDRLRNDMYCIRAVSEFYAYKAQAAMKVLRYQYSQKLTDLHDAVELLEKSLLLYRKLCELTQGSYRYANSLQTPTRRIPFDGSGGKFHHWSQCLPIYEKEFSKFKQKVQSILTAGKPVISSVKQERLQSVSVNLLSKNME